jgi:hypothetical protein
MTQIYIDHDNLQAPSDRERTAIVDVLNEEAVIIALRKLKDTLVSLYERTEYAVQIRVCDDGSGDIQIVNTMCRSLVNCMFDIDRDFE